MDIRVIIPRPLGAGLSSVMKLAVKRKIAKEVLEIISHIFFAVTIHENQFYLIQEWRICNKNKLISDKLNDDLKAKLKSDYKKEYKEVTSFSRGMIDLVQNVKHSEHLCELKIETFLDVTLRVKVTENHDELLNEFKIKINSFGMDKKSLALLEAKLIKEKQRIEDGAL